MQEEQNPKISESPVGYFEAEVLKTTKDGVTIVLRKPWEMNGSRQPAAIEIVEGKKPVKILTRQAAAVIAELCKKKVFQDFVPYLSTIEDLDSLMDAEVS